MTPELWLPVVGFEGRYDVSDQGRIRSLDQWFPSKAAGSRQFRPGRILNPFVNTRGYLTASLGKKRCSVHCLVMVAFAAQPQFEADGIGRDRDPSASNGWRDPDLAGVGVQRQLANGFSGRKPPPVEARPMIDLHGLCQILIACWMVYALHVVTIVLWVSP